MIKNKRAQALLEDIGKYLLWLVVIVVLAFGVIYLIKFLTGMGK